MAGYDLSFIASTKSHKIVKDWLNKYRKIIKIYNLEVSYRIKKFSINKIEIYVKIDGKLWAMQHLHRLLPEIISNYIYLGNAKSKKILFDFYKANETGVKGITGSIYSVSQWIRGKPSGITLSNSLVSKIDLNNPRCRDIKAIKSIIKTLDNWILKRISNKQAMILCDQEIEEWFKAKLRLSKNCKYGYQKIIKEAFKRKMIKKMEAYRLKRFHKSRNRVQHRGKKASTKTLVSMFEYCVNFLIKYY